MGHGISAAIGTRQCHPARPDGFAHLHHRRRSSDPYTTSHAATLPLVARWLGVTGSLVFFRYAATTAAGPGAAYLSGWRVTRDRRPRANAGDLRCHGSGDPGGGFAVRRPSGRTSGADRCAVEWRVAVSSPMKCLPVTRYQTPDRSIQTWEWIPWKLPQESGSFGDGTFMAGHSITWIWNTLDSNCAHVNRHGRRGSVPAGSHAVPPSVPSPSGSGPETNCPRAAALRADTP